MKIFKLIIILVSITLSHIGVNFAESSRSWRFHNMSNSNISVGTSQQAQEGGNVLLFNNTEIEVGGDSCPYYGRGSECFPQGFALQTINSAHLKGKHFHISGFARSSLTNFEELKAEIIDQHIETLRTQFEAKSLEVTSSTYKAQMKKWFDRSVNSDIDFYSRQIDLLREQADFGIKVLFHFAAKDDSSFRIEQYLPTSYGALNQVGQWNRFNVEVSVPTDCTALSIVLWSEGFNIVEFDHMAIVEHGDSLERQRPDGYFSKFDDLYDYFTEQGVVVNPLFGNPSFEY